MRLIYFISFIILLFLVSCNNENDISSKIVVEGWIEENKPPIVMVHKTYTFNQNVEHDFEDIIAEHLITWGKATIDNGENEQILVGQLDMDLVLPYKYSTARMLGEVNKEYTITVEYEDNIVYATTQILPKVKVDSIKIISIDYNKYDIRVHFQDYNDNKTHYYLLLYKFFGDKQYAACPMGITNSTQSQEGSLSIIANRRLTSLITDSASSTYFQQEDSVFFKLCHIDSTAYEIWNSYLSQNFSPQIPLLSTNNLQTNINNGLGYWCGLNGTENLVIVETDTTLIY